MHPDKNSEHKWDVAMNKVNGLRKLQNAIHSPFSSSSFFYSAKSLMSISIYLFIYLNFNNINFVKFCKREKLLLIIACLTPKLYCILKYKK